MFKKLCILYYYYLNKFQPKFKTRSKLKAFQDKEVKKFLKKVMKQSKFYSALYKDQDLNNWRSFPIIDKQIMMDNLDNLNTKGIKKQEAFKLALKAEKERNFTPTLNNITVGLSSGTKGNRGIFLASNKERYLWAGAILNKVLPYGIFNKYKIAFF